MLRPLGTRPPPTPPSSKCRRLPRAAAAAVSPPRNWPWQRRGCLVQADAPPRGRGLLIPASAPFSDVAFGGSPGSERLRRPRCEEPTHLTASEPLDPERCLHRASLSPGASAMTKCSVRGVGAGEECGEGAPEQGASAPPPAPT